MHRGLGICVHCLYIYIYIYIWVCKCICIYVCMYIYIYIERERETTCYKPLYTMDRNSEENSRVLLEVSMQQLSRVLQHKVWDITCLHVWYSVVQYSRV